ncbi:histidinol dehydrogenase [Aestuariimicrobium ganziense]|uniref:histidinol dehydrogenase n=1 Tax=Aestuariimicrobium ganziense TaxID=2773677 RepID=UPI001942C4C1|nr:histidinol dehydrogenase [Aestuariimicrobium ganziense]
MLQLLDVRSMSDREAARCVPRAEFDVEHAVEQVRPIVAAVAERGLEALQEFSLSFDRVVPASVRVPSEVIEAAADALDPALREAFEESIRRRRAVCELAEREQERHCVELAPGARVSQRIVPVGRVGLYVPGGLAPLASSVIMNVVPAQVAGVGSIALASPPQRDHDGWPHPTILAVCHLLGVDEVYAVGGAQAIAMFAHGVDGVCEKVDMVTGPGNIYVVAAKRLLRGLVGIDSEAGPTEIAILADETANPAYVAADLISQAEHDPQAASVLVTESEALIDDVRDELVAQVAATKHHERVTTALTGRQSAFVLVRDLGQGLAVVNAYGAEHLEVQTRDAAAVADRVTSAGAIFVGDHAPVSLGDYSAGSTHVLPTAGCACHSSGLSVRSFMKAVHVIDYTAEALLDLADGVEAFALAEDLPGHAAAITVRRPTTGAIDD